MDGGIYCLTFFTLIAISVKMSSAFSLTNIQEQKIGVANETLITQLGESYEQYSSIFYTENMYKSYIYLKNRDSIKKQHKEFISSLFTKQAVGRSVYDILTESLKLDKKKKEQGSALKSLNLSASCETDLIETLIAVAEQKTWALRVVDAAGKIGSGILYGNIHWYGSYDECLEIVATSTSDNKTKTLFETKYFLTSLGQGVSSIELGVCVPESCNSADVNSLVLSVLSMVSLGNMRVNSVEKMPTFALDGPAIAMICVLTLLLVLLTIATAYDILIYQPMLEREKEQEVKNSGEVSGSATPTAESNGILRPDEYTPLLAAKAGKPMTSTKDIGFVGKVFSKISLYTNAQKLLHTGVPSEGTLSSVHGVRLISMTWVILGHTYFFNLGNTPLVEKVFKSFSLYSNSIKLTNTGPSSGTLSSIHGVRLFSMLWVILGHTYFFLMLVGTTENVLYFEQLVKRFSFQAIINATVSVDTFFLMSGLLVSYLVLKEMKEKGGPRKINWLLFYFHRFWRLTPPYMLVLGTYTALYKYFGNGPAWPGDVPEPFCHQYWWTNLLYINNIVHSNTGCMMWSWYLANDMQFHLLSPLFLIPLYLHFGAGLAVVMVFMLVSFITTGVISVQYALPPSTPAALYYLDKIIPFFQKIYLVPWTRIGPYLVGVLIGYALYRTDRKINLSKWLVWLGWVAAAVCNLAILYGLYDQAKGAPIDVHLSAFYNTVHRTLWAGGVGWVIFACVTGYGGPVNKLLSWPVLVPFSRLTYMAYLVHPIIMEWYYQSRRTALYLDDVAVIYLFFGHLALSYGVGFVLSLAFEAPMMGLEKLLFKRK